MPLHQPSMLLVLTPVVLSFLPFTVNAATARNGHVELCSRNYGNVTYVGAYSSYVVGVNNPFTNQYHDTTQQLNDGVRLHQVQACENSGDISLCHTLCGLSNGGTLLDYLNKVKTWMGANPEDVVTLLIANSDNLAATQFASVFVATGVDSISYSPQPAYLPASGGPTLGSIIDAGTHLITFCPQQPISMQHHI